MVVLTKKSQQSIKYLMNKRVCMSFCTQCAHPPKEGSGLWRRQSSIILSSQTVQWHHTVTACWIIEEGCVFFFILEDSGQACWVIVTEVGHDADFHEAKRFRCSNCGQHQNKFSLMINMYLARAQNPVLLWTCELINGALKFQVGSCHLKSLVFKHTLISKFSFFSIILNCQAAGIKMILFKTCLYSHYLEDN